MSSPVPPNTTLLEVITAKRALQGPARAKGQQDRVYDTEILCGDCDNLLGR